MGILHKLFLMILIWAFIPAGCDKSPTQEIKETKAAVESASNADTETYAKDELAALKKNLAEALDEVKVQDDKLIFRNYDRAEIMLPEVRVYAKKVEALASDRKAEARENAGAAQTEARDAVDAAKALLEQTDTNKTARDICNAGLEGLGESLSDETKRRQYDEKLERNGSSLRIRKVPQMIHERISRVNRMEGLFSSSVDDLLEGFLPGFFDAGKGRIDGKDLYFEAVLAPEEAANGGLFPVTIPVMEPCPRCSRSGLFENFFCPACNGYGRVPSERELLLSIPPNVKHGTEVRLFLEDIGLKNVFLNIVVYIDPELNEFG